MEPCKEPKEVDLHDLRLFDAEVTMCEAIEEAWAVGRECVLLIHGYNNGVAIRDFIRGPGGLGKRLHLHYPEIPEVRIIPRDKGSTYVLIGEGRGGGTKG